MDALAAFLRARIDHDEQVARSAARNGDTWEALIDPDPNGYPAELFAAHLDSPRRCEEHPPGIPNLCDDNRIATADCDFPARDEGDALIIHAALFDPRRMLAEIEWKREIVADYEMYAASPKQGTFLGWDALRTTCERLARIWSEHPDYRENWPP